MQQPLRRARDLQRLVEPQPGVSPVRLRVFSAFLAALFVLLLGRLWFLQIFRGDVYRLKALGNSSRPVRRPAPRGVIEDAHGVPLVSNRAQFTVFVSPADLPRPQRARAVVLARLAEILALTPSELSTVMRRNRAGASDPIPVKENVTARVLARIAENRLRLPGVLASAEPVRFYPHDKLAGHVLGYIGQIGEEELADKKNAARGYRPGDFIGRSGVERQYDSLLNGAAGGTYYEIDAHGRRRRELRVEKPRPGATLRLSISKKVQEVAERELAGRLGAAVAVDPRDGRVIALASGPAFSPSFFARRPIPSADYARLTDAASNYPLQNRAVSSPQPPGSTFKIVTAAAGLATGTITARTSAFCPGYIRLGPRAIKRCHATHGGVNLDSALAASCDVFFYQAGFRIQPTPLADWAGKFGLGARSGIDLPSEYAGIVPSPAWKALWARKFGNPETGWYPGDTANVAIGQGDLLTTPLQMSLVASAIAADGVIFKPQVLLRATGADKKITYQMKPQVLRRLPLSTVQLSQIARGMRSVVAGPRGTSHAANLQRVAVAGKSGSAEVRGPRGGTHAWFICYAPFEKPTIAICVMLEANGRHLHGGADAAPIARKMLAAHFGVPDRLVAAGGRGARAD